MPAIFDHNFAHRHVAVSHSTNSELIAAVKAATIDSGCPYLLTASSQTAGRGQHGRTWQSPAGNVYLSLYYPLEVPLSGLLSLMIGYHLTRLPVIMSLNRQLRQGNVPLIGIKWANDIGFYAAGRQPQNSTDSPCTLCFNKLAGILIEPVWVGARITGVVVGVGLNVVQAPPLITAITANQDSLNYTAISLSQLIACATNDSYTSHINPISGEMGTELLNPSLKPDDLYLPISGAIVRAISQFKACYRHPYSIHQFVGDYASVDVLAGQRVMIQSQPICQPEPLQSNTKHSAGDLTGTALDAVNTDKTDDAKPITGLVLGIGTDGSLRLQPDGGAPLRIYAGNIKVLAP